MEKIACQWVILDRDGVINQDSAEFIKSPAEWQPIAGSVEAIARLAQHQVSVAIASNQSGLARALFDLKTLHAIHDKMYQTIAAAGGHINHLEICPHGPDEGCTCRKPRPGMIDNIIKKYGILPQQVSVVGDALRDLQAAAAAGCVPVLVLTGKGAKTLAEQSAYFPAGTQIYPDLSAFVDAYLHRQKP